MFGRNSTLFRVGLNKKKVMVKIKDLKQLAGAYLPGCHITVKNYVEALENENSQIEENENSQIEDLEFCNIDCGWYKHTLSNVIIYKVCSLKNDRCSVITFNLDWRSISDVISGATLHSPDFERIKIQNVESVLSHLYKLITDVVLQKGYVKSNADVISIDFNNLVITVNDKVIFTPYLGWAKIEIKKVYFFILKKGENEYNVSLTKVTIEEGKTLYPRNIGVIEDSKTIITKIHYHE